MTLQDRVVDWHRRRFPDAGPVHVALKACEEVGELAGAVLGAQDDATSTGDGDALSEAADVMICLMALLGRWGHPVSDCDLLAAVERKLAILTDPTSSHRSALRS